MYILLSDNTVAEIIPDVDPIFPGVPIGERYAADFVASLLHVGDETAVEQNWAYDPETGTFAPPPEPEPKQEPEMIPAADLDAAYREGVNTYV